MDEDELKKYVPCYGDRLALLNFCKKQLAPRKYSLIEKLRAKVAAKNSNHKTNDIKHASSNLRRNSVSTQKKIPGLWR